MSRLQFFVILLNDLTTKDYRQNLLLEVTLQLQQLPISDRLPLSVCVRIQLPKNCDTKTKLGLKLWHLCMIIKQIMLNLQSWLISAVVTKNPVTASTMMASSSLQQSARVSLLSRQGGEVWRKVTMVAKFRDHNNRELKQRIGRRQRERQKSKWFILAKQTLCTCITPFCTFLSRRYTTATWNFLISCARFMEWVNTTVKIFLFVFLT